ncbi:MAG: hypothetical protein ABIJ61_06210 [bacterium]
MLAQLAALTVAITFTATWWSPSPAFDFLSKPATPHVVALGGCGITMVDAESSLYNPAALGMRHLDRKCSVSFPFHNTPILPRTNEAYTSTQEVSAGLSLRQLGLVSEKSPNLSLAFGYSRYKTDWGRLTGSNIGFGGEFDALSVVETVDIYSVAVAIDYRVRLALGYSAKKAYSDFARIIVNDGEAKLYDVGVMASSRLRTLLKRPGSPFAARSTYVSVEPTIAFVHQNGVRKLPPEDIFYRYPGQSLLNARNVLGFSLRGALDREGRAELVSFCALAEFAWETHSRVEIESAGAELGLGGVLFLRTGDRTESNFDRYSGGDILPAELLFLYDSHSFNSCGFGLDLDGVLAWLWELGWLKRPQPPLADLFESLNLSFDYARMSSDLVDDPDQAQTAINLSFSF